MPNVYSSCSVSLAISFFRGTARNILTHFRAFITSKPLMIQSICGASLEIPANCTGRFILPLHGGFLCFKANWSEIVSSRSTEEGIPRAFDTLPFPGSREFDFRTAVRGGEFDTKPRKVGNLTVRTRRAKRKC